MPVCTAAVKDESGRYYLNGHLVVESGRTEIIRHMAGSKFRYKLLDDDRDYLYSLGPLQDSLIIQVCVSNSFLTRISTVAKIARNASHLTLTQRLMLLKHKSPHFSLPHWSS